MIKFLLDALNNCDSNKAKYIKSLYYRYCQFIYDEINDSIYNNEEIFAMFLGEFIDLNKVMTIYSYSKIYEYKLPSLNRFNTFIIFKLSRSNEHTVAHLRDIIANNNKFKSFHKQLT